MSEPATHCKHWKLLTEDCPECRIEWQIYASKLETKLSASKASEAELLQSLEAAEARIKASKEQEPSIVKGTYRHGWRATYNYYKSPVIPPDVAELQRENAELRQLLAEAKSKTVPKGWQLVPLRPTDDMQRAGHEQTSFGQSAIPIYTAMLAAAPQPETGRGSND